MRKSVIVGLLCLLMFFGVYVGGIVVTIPCSQNVLDRTAQLLGDEGGSQMPFARVCGDEGGPAIPFNNQTGL
jgi:hypothetical protein